MAVNLLLTCGVMVACLAIQCLIVALLMKAMVEMDHRDLLRPGAARLTMVLAGVMLVMLFGNLMQMGLWAGLFWAAGEFATFRTAFYHSVVNFATLGYGDIVMSEDARLFGALEAANGVMMFGLSTAFLFSVLDAATRRALLARGGVRPSPGS